LQPPQSPIPVVTAFSAISGIGMECAAPERDFSNWLWQMSFDLFVLPEGESSWQGSEQ
jgi:hypothetical protein